MTGVVDLASAVALTVGVIKQAQFLPTTSAGCRDATDWNNEADGRNFFLEANKTALSNRFKHSPERICDGLKDMLVSAIMMM